MKTSSKLEQEIVIKRTYIENIYEDDNEDPSFILIRFLIYVPGQENLTCGSDEECWVYSMADQEWQQSDLQTNSLLCQFLGYENDVCVQTALNDLKDNETVTVGYNITIETRAGHSLPTCGSCIYWSKGHCELLKQNVPEDHIIPCSREFFEPKATQ